MAAKSNFHIRSNSFPSQSHPILQQCNDFLQTLRTSNATTSSSLGQKLSGVQELHECVDRLLQLQVTQQAFTQGREEKWIDHIVDGSLRLLEMCSAAKDAVLHTKEFKREIQSVIRRKRGAESCLENEIRKYSASRKVVKKAIKKAVRSLNNPEGKTPSSQTNQESETKAFVSVLREAEAVTLSVFESLLSFISGPKEQNKLGGLSLVSRLMRYKGIGCEETYEVNEFVRVDDAIHAFSSAEEVPKGSTRLRSLRSRL